MGGKNYIRKDLEAERYERAAQMQAAQDYLKLRMDRLGLNMDERRDLVRYSLDTGISIHTLLTELDHMRAEQARQSRDARGPKTSADVTHAR